MSKELPAVDLENVLEVDISKIALDDRFGSLKFDNANKKLTKIQQYLIEAKDLDFAELLLPNQADQVRNYQARLTTYLQRIQGFDVGSATGNPKGEHDQYEAEIDGFYNEIYEALPMKYLPFLREERRRENPDERKLDEEVRQAAQLRADLEEELVKVRADIEQIKNTKQEVGSAKGERAATQLARHFKEEARRYQDEADKYSLYLRVGYGFILLLFVVFTLFYAFGVWTLTLQTGIPKLVLAGALWYGLSFIIRNFNINSHLAAVNRHRAAVAETLEDFLATNPTATGEMLRNATEAMFRHTLVGYVSKSDSSSSNPMYEIVNTVMGSKANAS
jgi:hypothetical protein